MLYRAAIGALYRVYKGFGSWAAGLKTPCSLALSGKRDLLLKMVFGFFFFFLCTSNRKRIRLSTRDHGKDWHSLSLPAAGSWRGVCRLDVGTNLPAESAEPGWCSSSWICSLKSKSCSGPLCHPSQQIIEIHARQNTNTILHVKETDTFGEKSKREKNSLVGYAECYGWIFASPRLPRNLFPRKGSSPKNLIKSFNV